MAPLLARRPAYDRTFERLYRHHAGDVYRYALALLRDPTEAEDATQTAFMNAYRALVRGEEPRAPKAWLLAIVHNVCRMRRRSLARRPREVPLDDHPIAAVEDERPRLDVVLAALAELPLNQRAALVMREVEGRSYREIADVLDVSTSAVEALIFRARRRLRVRRDALGALAAAPLPASLGTLPGGVIATCGRLRRRPEGGRRRDRRAARGRRGLQGGHRHHRRGRHHRRPQARADDAPRPARDPHEHWLRPRRAARASSAEAGSRPARGDDDRGRADAPSSRKPARPRAHDRDHEAHVTAPGRGPAGTRRRRQPRHAAPRAPRHLRPLRPASGAVA